jgi:hypothetical protein
MSRRTRQRELTARTSVEHASISESFAEVEVALVTRPSKPVEQSGGPGKCAMIWPS